MKRFFSVLAVSVTLILAVVSCKQDKPSGRSGMDNSSEMDKFVSEASYICALPDDAPLILAVHPLQILSKSGFATDDAFIDLREQLYSDMDMETRIAVSSALANPALIGLDPQHPALLTLSDIDILRFDGDDLDIQADVHISVPITNRDLLMKLLREQAGSDFGEEKDGVYYGVEEKSAFAFTKKALIAYIPVGKYLSEDEMEDRIEAIVKKKSFHAGGFLAEAAILENKDLALFADDRLSAEILEAAKSQYDVDLVKIMGGNPGKDVMSLTTLDLLPGKAVLSIRTEGTNALFERIKGWAGTPDKKDLAKLPADSRLAGQFAFNNLSDAAAYIQSCIERIDGLDGYNIPEILSGAGLEMKDLDAVGTVSFGLAGNSNSGHGIVALKAGEKLIAALQGFLRQAGIQPVSTDPEVIYQLENGVALIFKEKHVFLAVDTDMGGWTIGFNDENRLFGELSGNSLAVDLGYDVLSGFDVPYPFLGVFDYAVARLDSPQRVEIFFQDKASNAAKTLLSMVFDYLQYSEGSYSYEEEEYLDDYSADDFFNDPAFADDDLDYLF